MWPISFEQDERRREVNRILADEKIFKPLYNKENLSGKDRQVFTRDFNDKILNKNKEAFEYLRTASTISKNLFRTDNSQFIIEEPEQNLFPETQRDLVYYLLQKCLNKKGNRLTLTTHSPYVLYALNNCMMAGLVNEKMSSNELNKLKCNQSKINPSDVSIYEIKDGVVKGTIQGEDGLISDNYFDQKMKELMDHRTNTRGRDRRVSG